MITIKNNLNQSLSIGDRSLAVDGSIKVRAIDDEIERLVKRGYVSIIEPEAEPAVADDTKQKEKK